MTQLAELLPGTLDRRLGDEVSSWTRLSDAIALALRATPQGT